MKPLVATDMDGVLADWFGRFIRRASIVLGRQLKYEDWVHYNCALWLGMTTREIKRLLEQTGMLANLNNLELIPGSREAIENLEAEYEVVIITSRPDHQHDQTLDFLGRHFPSLADRICYGCGKGNPYAQQNGRKLKEEIAEELQAVCLIEDNPHEFDGWTSQSVLPICFAQPWNRCLEQTHPHIPRLDWNGILEYMVKNRGS